MVEVITSDFEQLSLELSSASIGKPQPCILERSLLNDAPWRLQSSLATVFKRKDPGILISAINPLDPSPPLNWLARHKCFMGVVVIYSIKNSASGIRHFTGQVAIKLSLNPTMVSWS